MADLLKLGAQERFQKVQNSKVRMTHLLQSSVQQAHQHVDELGIVILHRMEQKIEFDKQSLVRLKSQLRMLNPLAVLGRGYSLTRKSDGSVVRSVESVRKGESIITQLADGKVVSNVTKKE